MELKQKWLLDTDIGCDSDDCMALGYLLARKDVDLIGVTTVSGESHRRALFADTICYGTGRNIPVVRGNDFALNGSCVQANLSKAQAEQTSRYPHNDIPDMNLAVEFLRKKIEANPGEITLAVIGQMTNIALLFATYPHITELLKSMVIMGGRYYDREWCDVSKWGFTEWNIMCDTYAAAIVMNAPVHECYVIGVELSCQFKKPAAEVSEKIAVCKYMKPVSDAIQNYDVTWFHDAVAVWAMLERERQNWICGEIKVDLNAPEGVTTMLIPSCGGRHRLLADVDVDLFFKEYADTMGFVWNE